MHCLILSAELFMYSHFQDQPAHREPRDHWEARELPDRLDREVPVVTMDLLAQVDLLEQPVLAGQLDQLACRDLRARQEALERSVAREPLDLRETEAYQEVPSLSQTNAKPTMEDALKSALILTTGTAACAMMVLRSLPSINSTALVSHFWMASI